MARQRNSSRTYDQPVGDDYGDDDYGDDDDRAIDYVNCNEIFGGVGRSCRIDWFLPTAVWFPPDVLPLVLGYTSPSCGDSVVGAYDLESDGGRAAPPDAIEGARDLRDGEGKFHLQMMTLDIGQGAGKDERKATGKTEPGEEDRLLIQRTKV